MCHSPHGPPVRGPLTDGIGSTASIRRGSCMQFTLRNIPPFLDRALRRLAREQARVRLLHAGRCRTECHAKLLGDRLCWRRKDAVDEEPSVIPLPAEEHRNIGVAMRRELRVHCLAQHVATDSCAEHDAKARGHLAHVARWQCTECCQRVESQRIGETLLRLACGGSRR